MSKRVISVVLEWKDRGHYRAVTVAEDPKELSHQQAAPTLELAALWRWHSLSLLGIQGKLKDDLYNADTSLFLFFNF